MKINLCDEGFTVEDFSNQRGPRRSSYSGHNKCNQSHPDLEKSRRAFVGAMGVSLIFHPRSAIIAEMIVLTRSHYSTDGVCHAQERCVAKVDFPHSMRTRQATLR